MAWQIMEMSINDYAEVMTLWRNTPGVGLTEADAPDAVAAYLRRNPGMSLVARDGGQLVGTVLCGHDGRRGCLYHLAVAPSHRRLGIGRALVRRCLDALGRAGVDKCNIFVYADNDDGGAFWHAAGWRTRPDLRLMQHMTKGEHA